MYVYISSTSFCSLKLLLAEDVRADRMSSLLRHFQAFLYFVEIFGIRLKLQPAFFLFLLFYISFTYHIRISVCSLTMLEGFNNKVITLWLKDESGHDMMFWQTLASCSLVEPLCCNQFAVSSFSLLAVALCRAHFRHILMNFLLWDQ